MKAAVVGCGHMSDVYIRNMNTRFSGLQVAACCAAHLENALKKAAEHGIRGCTYEEILGDPDIDIVVILTPAPTHYGLIKQALEAGKHVYTEKTMTVDLRQARELLELAEAKGLYLGAAPDTFLGAAWQKARQMVDAGVLGEITSFQICANRNLDALASRYLFLRLPGGGICYDYGVYYLTALVSLLGPVGSVAAVVENRKPLRVNCLPDSPECGKAFAYENEGQVTAILRTKGGVTGSFTLNGESIGTDLAVVTLYGTKGVLKLTNPNHFGGEIRLVQTDAQGIRECVLENELPYADNSRGLGVAEMAAAIREKRPNRAGKELAFHVLDIISAIMESGKNGTFVDVDSTCDLPQPLAGEQL